MNAIKNALVTTTLIAVGYGVYVILASPGAGTKQTTQLGNPWALSSSQSGQDGSAPTVEDLGPPAVTLPNQASTAPPMETVAPIDQGPPAVSSDVGQYSQPAHVPSVDGMPQHEPAPPEQIEQAMGEVQGAVENFQHSVVATARTALEAQRSQMTQAVDNLGRHATNQIMQHLAPHVQGELSAPTQATQPDYYADRDAVTQATATSPQETRAAGIPNLDTHTQETHLSGQSSGFSAAWETAQQQIGRGEMANALFSLSIWYQDQSLSEAQRVDCLRLMDELAGTVIYSREHHLQPAYVVREGDTLASIAEQFQIPEQFLARVNGLQAPYGLAHGTAIKVVQGPFRAEIDVVRGEMTLFAGSYYAGRFPVDANSQSVPKGRYELASKTNDPAYTDPQTGQQVLGGQPDNPFGRYWLGLRNETTPPDQRIGLHGTAAQPTPNQPTGGSLRLSMRDIEDVQAILSLGSPVTIR